MNIRALIMHGPQLLLSITGRQVSKFRMFLLDRRSANVRINPPSPRTISGSSLAFHRAPSQPLTNLIRQLRLSPRKTGASTLSNSYNLLHPLPSYRTDSPRAMTQRRTHAFQLPPSRDRTLAFPRHLRHTSLTKLHQHNSNTTNHQSNARNIRTSCLRNMAGPYPRSHGNCLQENQHNPPQYN